MKAISLGARQSLNLASVREVNFVKSAFSSVKHFWMRGNVILRAAASGLSGNFFVDSLAESENSAYLCGAKNHKRMSFPLSLGYRLRHILSGFFLCLTYPYSTVYGCPYLKAFFAHRSDVCGFSRNGYGSRFLLPFSEKPQTMKAISLGARQSLNLASVREVNFVKSAFSSVKHFWMRGNVILRAAASGLSGNFFVDSLAESENSAYLCGAKTFKRVIVSAEPRLSAQTYLVGLFFMPVTYIRTPLAAVISVSIIALGATFECFSRLSDMTAVFCH